MQTIGARTVLWAALVGVMWMATGLGADYLGSLQQGKADLKSVGVLAFGPEGILFVGDSTGGAVFAIDTADASRNSSTDFKIDAIDAKVAAMLGTTAPEISIHDLAVHPISRRVYLSVSRGRGPDATGLILRTDASGTIRELDLENVRHARVELPNPPDPSATDRRGRSRRLEAITDLAFVDGNLIVAGLSNEEFSSNLRSIPFPFDAVDGGSSVEIFHGAHGRFETHSPVRTFVPFEIQSEPHILAAYTCTPLVKFPLKQLKPGSKIMGTTIAELGNRNRPLDMIVYEKDGAQYILMNNSSRGVMKLPTKDIHSYPGITERTDVAGLPYQTIESLKGVQQLDSFSGTSAMALVRGDSGSLALQTVALP